MSSKQKPNWVSQNAIAFLVILVLTGIYSYGIWVEEMRISELQGETNNLQPTPNLEKWTGCRDHAWDVCGLDSTPLLYNELMEKGLLIEGCLSEQTVEKLSHVVKDMRACWNELAEECDSKYYVEEGGD